MAEYIKRLREQMYGSHGTATEEKPRGTGYKYNYKPNKENRKLRVHIMDRYRRMRDDPLRKEAEADWEQGDKKARMWRPERDADDWRADIRLPDAFAAIQTHLQETVGMKIRPSLKPQEGSDTPLAFWANGILDYNMDRTGYDWETIKAINCSAVRGTAFTVEDYIYETRTVKNPTSVEAGILQYKEEEIVDKDDTFMTHWPNERVFVDEAATWIDNAEDMILEERMRFDTFKMKYGNRDDYFDTDKVIPCGSLSTQTNFFDRSDDDPMEGDYVQVLRYYNRQTDTYGVMANTIIIRNSPIPFKHKELPLAIWNYYPVEGRIWGMGIPKIISPTQEEREAIRNLSLDRLKMSLNKMFVVSDLFDLDEDEATTRPHGFIHVNAGGLSLEQVIKPLEYGEVPGSSVRMDDNLRDDEKRVTGIDDRSQGVNMGGTATEAAILTENSQKRINLINTLTGMATIERIGKLKWSNIQFFYKAPTIQRIVEDNNERTKKVHRKIGIEGKEFEVVEDNGEKRLKMNNIDGVGNFNLDGTHARFFDGDWDIRIQWDIKGLMPAAIRQAKLMETFTNMVGNPFTMKEMNIRRAMKDLLMESGVDPRTWMSDQGETDEEQMIKAQWENMAMMKGEALDPTRGASEMHTLVHLWFTETDTYKKMVEKNPGIGMIFERHIMGENQAGPGGMAAGQGQAPAGAGMDTAPGMENMPPPTLPDPNAMPATGPAGAGNSAAPGSAPPVTAMVNGGQVTNDTAPVR